MAQQVIGFIGAGNMATSLVGGMIAKGIRPARIWMSDVSEARLAELGRQHRVHTTTRNDEVAQRCDALVLAVKPQVMAEVCASLRPHFGDRAPLIISIAAGVTVDNLRTWLGDVPVIRTMPNTPALVQAGATGLFAGPGVTEEHRTLANQIMGSVGLSFWFEQESELDVVTAVSGSGPAYFFLLMEAMINAGEQLGLDSRTARQLVLQTAWGAAQLAITSEQPPATLREQVTSPGGTTAAALNVFEQAGLRDLVDKALTAARDRARELAK
ncbi:pyrroline-5-carboxylate reductase [Alcanivorax sp. S71-1-4]|jgi:pyrroline-5-carboxylate reductase|uniref:pyrroline-5-carboxylate reductase n=1 Tax=Alcanivorax sp. S71-1-4 TaxID=1177159 RepID=UPI00135AE5D2|nr:pyrroline-5-carboxylate reductase [Alcanivorax sp. S71-1-4]KAF0810960.1 pyrroline-5-carboxylate reductase [Alcanivorax sp. S71-1-4]